MPADPANPVDQSFDLYARLVCRALAVPSALVTFARGDRLMIPGAVGLPEALADVRESPLGDSLCQFVVRGGEPVLIDDVATMDLGHLDSIEAEMGIRAYAGWPLTDHRGEVIGSLCGIDHVPHAWSGADARALGDVAAACSAEIAQRELRELALQEEATARLQAEQGQLLLSLSEALLATTTLVEIALAVDRLAVQQLGCRHALLWLVSDDHGDCGGGAVRCLELARMPGDEHSLAADYHHIDLTEGNPVGHTCLLRAPRYFSSREDQAQAYPEHPASEWFGEARAFLPLTLGGEPVGSLAVGWPAARTLGATERATLVALASYTAQAVHRATLLRERVHSSLTLQRALLTELPSPQGLQLVARYRPASTTEQVGGDWYDALVLPGGGTTVACGDVVGHDITAAAAMGQVRSALRAFAWAIDDGPSNTVTQLDRALEGLGIDALATLVCARIDATDDADLPWCLTWTSAGHPPPVLLDERGRVQTLVPAHQDLLLGVVPGEVRHNDRVGVAAGSTLLLFTDGLVERRGESVDEGLQRLRSHLTGLRGRPLEDLVDALLADMLPEDLDDDVALLAVRFGTP